MECSNAPGDVAQPSPAVSAASSVRSAGGRPSSPAYPQAWIPTIRSLPYRGASAHRCRHQRPAPTTRGADRRRRAVPPARPRREDPARAKIFLELSETAKGHLKHWADKLRAAGVDPGDPGPSLRVRVLGFLATPDAARGRVADGERWSPPASTTTWRRPTPAAPRPRGTGARAHAERTMPLAGRQRQTSRASRAASAGTASRHRRPAPRRDLRYQRRPALNLSLVIGVAGASPEGRLSSSPRRQPAACAFSIGARRVRVRDVAARAVPNARSRWRKEGWSPTRRKAALAGSPLPRERPACREAEALSSAHPLIAAWRWNAGRARSWA